ncbi:putative exonuclease 1 [Diaporthe ampelina]|uniref:Putative exonuclease 1 n=1 Tax=Diaporthe ampelina TaxID=1214573 RepID=A0A0G2FGX2_9PEZI|nr:putative exonuclease 1 [Diaporthe ampelina]
MGIQGLLPLLKSIQKPTELKKFSAQGKPTSKYVDFAMHRVRMVKHFGVTPYLVFDGDFLPSKAHTEAARAKRREESRKAGLELLKAGKPSQAQFELQKAIDVTPEMARHLIEELKKADVPYVVAPYEADSQLVYLERHDFINGIISEDSDLLVFGAKRLLTKMDHHGQCIEINRRDFCAVREISLTGWTDDQFRQMTIFSGCDYLEGIGNMGLKTAYRMMRKYKTPERVIRMLQFDGKFRVSENYLAQYKQAELTFLYQRVFCPKTKDLVLLTEPPASSPLDIEEMPESQDDWHDKDIGRDIYSSPTEQTIPG